MRIATVRDSALDAIKKANTKFDYVLMLDADVFELSIRGIIASFSDHIPSWDVLTANGRYWNFSLAFSILPYVKNAYYDTFAIQQVYDEAKPFDRQISLWRIFSALRKNSMLFPVCSAFGGMGLYKYKAVETARYFDASQEDDFQFCEHISFHRKLKEAGFPSVFVNPAMMLYYNNPLRAFFSGLVKTLIGKKIHALCKALTSKRKLRIKDNETL